MQLVVDGNEHERRVKLQVDPRPYSHLQQHHSIWPQIYFLEPKPSSGLFYSFSCSSDGLPLCLLDKYPNTFQSDSLKSFAPHFQRLCDRRALSFPPVAAVSPSVGADCLHMCLQSGRSQSAPGLLIDICSWNIWGFPWSQFSRVKSHTKGSVFSSMSSLHKLLTNKPSGTPLAWSSSTPHTTRSQAVRLMITVCECLGSEDKNLLNSSL